MRTPPGNQFGLARPSVLPDVPPPIRDGPANHFRLVLLDEMASCFDERGLDVSGPFRHGVGKRFVVQGARPSPQVRVTHVGGANNRTRAYNLRCLPPGDVSTTARGSTIRPVRVTLYLDRTCAVT